MIETKENTVAGNRSGVKEPLPADVRESFSQTSFGPCGAPKRFIPMQTNMLGEVQVHACAHCRRPHFYSEKYGFVWAEDRDFKDRAQALVDQAYAEGAL